MALITAGDIEAMRERGYDRGTIANAERRLALTAQARAIVEQIHKAFGGVMLGDGIGLWEAQGLDDYEDEETCALYRAKDEKTDWSAITIEALERCQSSPSFFDADGFRFHLPAYMCADLLEEGECDITDSLICFKILKYRQYASLFPAHRAAVRAYLLYQRDYPLTDEVDQANIERALQTYWTEESCRP